METVLKLALRERTVHLRTIYSRLPATLKNLKWLAFQAVKQNGTLLAFVSDRLKHDFEVCYMALRQNPRGAFPFVSPTIKNMPYIKNLMSLLRRV